MQRTLISRRLVPAGIAAALAFGAAQAVAAPAGGSSARACNQARCSEGCIARGFDGGACVNGQCLCFTITP